MLLATRVLSWSEARDSIDLDVIVLIAASFGLGAALESTGLASTLADGVTGALGGLGSWGLVLAIVLVTLALSEVVTNNAAAVVVLPIALSVAGSAGLDPRTVAIAVRDHCLGVVPEPDRLPDQHDGLRPGWLPIR